MPNWCENQVTVQGKPATLQRLIAAADPSDPKLGQFSLEKLVPCPDELRKTTARSDFEMYYEAKYGTHGEWKRIANYPWVLEAHDGVAPPRAWLIKFLEDRNPESAKGGEQIRENVKKYGSKTWYDWAISNWGTKWDIGAHLEYDFGSDSFTLIFDSAWSPPLEAFRKISDEWKVRVIFEYYEPGMDFVGTALIQDGVIVEEREGKISKDSDRFDFCPDYSDDEFFEDHDF